MLNYVVRDLADKHAHPVKTLYNTTISTILEKKRNHLRAKKSKSAQSG